MPESINERAPEATQSDLERSTEDYLTARTKLIDDLKLLSLPDLIRLLRGEKLDPICGLAGSAGVYDELAAVHFPGDNPAGAMNFLLTMALRFVDDDELDEEAPKAQAWVLTEWSEAYGLITE